MNPNSFNKDLFNDMIHVGVLWIISIIVSVQSPFKWKFTLPFPFVMPCFWRQESRNGAIPRFWVVDRLWPSMFSMFILMSLPRKCQWKREGQKYQKIIGRQEWLDIKVSPNSLCRDSVLACSVCERCAPFLKACPFFCTGSQHSSSSARSSFAWSVS